jgi:hypothetical protein
MKSRYIPITQQPYCCAAACIQMVMYRHGIPLIPQEDIAFELGLIVPKKDEFLFQKVQKRDKGRKGWGTNIGWKNYSLSEGLKRSNIPLSARFYLSEELKSSEELKLMLSDLQDEGVDILLCYDYREVWGGEGETSHVCVFDKIENNTVWMIDPEQNVPKFRHTTVNKLFKGIKKNGSDSFNGMWLLEPIKK